MHHNPVLLETTLNYLALKPGATVIDATLGDGGHTQAILNIIGPTGHVIGIDASPVSLERAKDRLTEYEKQIFFVHGNFAEMDVAILEADIPLVDGILMDLGVASWQLDEPKIGLSFQRDELLDMRLDPRRASTAATILNRSSLNELTEMFESYGDLHRARPLAARIISARERKPLTTTAELVEIIGTHSPKVLAPIFQALRIAVNDELGVLASALDKAINLLKPAGRLVVISYHSGEDRIVKMAFRRFESDGLVNILTSKPLIPTEEEQRSNSRSRSAKLRAIEKI